jgi:SSS family solute:Na+ symporter
MLNSIDYGIIIIYFLIIVGVGVFSIKFTKNKEDFLVAGRRLPFFMYFGCMCALAIGGAATIGSSKWGYKVGISGIWLNGSIGIGIILLGILVTSKLSKMKAVSINQVFGANYGPRAELFSSLITFIYTLMLSVTQVIAIGTLLNSMLGWPLITSTILGGSIVIFYTFVGGMWSVTMTDIIQFVVMTIGVIILAPFFSVAKAGGLNHVISSLPPTHFSLTNIGWEMILTYLVLFVPGLLVGQDIWQRVFTAKDEKVARTGSIAAGVYCIIYGLAAVLIGACVFVVFPNLENPQTAFATGVINFLPTGVKGFVLAGALSAIMSTASGTILASSTILYNDIYDKYITKGKKAEKALLANRVCAIIIGGITMVIALGIKDVLVSLDLAYAYLSGCVCVPLIASFILKRFNPNAGLASIASSFVVVTGLFFKFGITSNYPILAGIVVGLVVYGVVNSTGKFKIEPAAIYEDSIAGE